MTPYYVALISAASLVAAAAIGRQAQQARKVAGTANKKVDDATMGLFRAIEEASRGRMECEARMAKLQQQHAVLQEQHRYLQEQLEELRRKVERRASE